MPVSPLELVVLIGLQGAGKSTFRRKFFDATHSVVSKDLLRNNRRPQRRQIELIHDALAQERYEKVGFNPVTGSAVPAERRRIKRDEALPLGQNYDEFILARLDPGV